MAHPDVLRSKPAPDITLGITTTNVIRVTLDTNILPADDLMASVPSNSFEFAVVTVTDRELEKAAALLAPPTVERVPETMVWGESPWGVGVWAGPEEGARLEKVLSVIADGSFPPPSRHAALTAGQRRQVRDAMIFCAHIRSGREIFVTNDTRGFVRVGRRQMLEETFGTRIMTSAEFVSRFSGA